MAALAPQIQRWLVGSPHMDRHPLLQLTYAEIAHCLMIPPAAVLMATACPSWHTLQYARLDTRWQRIVYLHRAASRVSVCGRTDDAGDEMGLEDCDAAAAPPPKKTNPQTTAGKRAGLGVSARTSPVRAWGVVSRSPEQVLQTTLEDTALTQVTSVTDLKFAEICTHHDTATTGRARQSTEPVLYSVAYEAMCLARIVYAFYSEFAIDLHGAGYIVMPHQMHEARDALLTTRVGNNLRHPIMVRTYVDGWFVSHVSPIPAAVSRQVGGGLLLRIPCDNVIACFVAWLGIVRRDYGMKMRCRTNIERWSVLFATGEQ